MLINENTVPRPAALLRPSRAPRSPSLMHAPRCAPPPAAHHARHPGIQRRDERRLGAARPRVRPHRLQVHQRPPCPAPTRPHPRRTPPIITLYSPATPPRGGWPPSLTPHEAEPLQPHRPGQWPRDIAAHASASCQPAPRTPGRAGPGRAANRVHGALAVPGRGRGRDPGSIVLRTGIQAGTGEGGVSG